MRVFVILILMCLLGGCASSGSSSSSTSEINGKIRFYRVNSDGQQVGFTLVKDTEKTGCQNMLKRSSLHRIAVSGFQYCEVYAEKNCAAGSKLSALWLAKRVKSEDKLQPTTQFTKGSRWIFDREGNIKAHSWRCYE